MVAKNDEVMRTIGEVAESLDLPQHVLRFWETRFKEIDPFKRAGGRRFYRQRDIDLVIAIRHLLYNEGYTIKGVQRILKEQGVAAVVADVSRRISGEQELEPAPNDAVEAESLSVPEAESAEGGDWPKPDAAASVAPHPVEAQEPDAGGNAAVLTQADTAESAEPPLPPPRPLDEGDATLLRAILDEIDECRRLLRLTLR